MIDSIGRSRPAHIQARPPPAGLYIEHQMRSPRHCSTHPRCRQPATAAAAEHGRRGADSPPARPGRRRSRRHGVQIPVGALRLINKSCGWGGFGPAVAKTEQLPQCSSRISGRVAASRFFLEKTTKDDEDTTVTAATPRRLRPCAQSNPRIQRYRSSQARPPRIQIGFQFVENWTRTAEGWRFGVPPLAGGQQNIRVPWPTSS